MFIHKGSNIDQKNSKIIVFNWNRKTLNKISKKDKKEKAHRYIVQSNLKVCTSLDSGFIIS